MKVSSPVGEFPFELERLRRQGTHLSLEGRMGAWPARVEVSPQDGVRLARAAGATFVLPLLGALVLGRGIRRVARGRR